MSWTYNRIGVAEQKVDLARRAVIAARKRLNTACDDRDMEGIRLYREQFHAARLRMEESRELLDGVEG